MARAGNKGHRHCPEPGCEVCRASRLRYKRIADAKEKEQLQEHEDQKKEQGGANERGRK